MSPTTCAAIFFQVRLTSTLFFLQTSGRAGFKIRHALAATLSSVYGVYSGFELCEIYACIRQGRVPQLGKIPAQTLGTAKPDSLKEIIALVNRIRRDNPALHGDRSLRFHPVDNSQLICFSKQSDDLTNAIVVVVNLDPRHHSQSGWR